MPTKMEEQFQFEAYFGDDVDVDLSWNDGSQHYKETKTRILFTGWQAGRKVLRAAIMGTD